jgi:hypothetical protein
LRVGELRFDFRRQLDGERGIDQLLLGDNNATGLATDFGLGNRYPPLAKLGPVTTDLRSTR